MTDEQRKADESLARLRRALSGQPEPHHTCDAFDALFRKFTERGDKDKEVRDDPLRH